MKARASACALSKTHGRFSLAIARSDCFVTTLCLIGALYFPSSAQAEGQRVWSRIISSEPANSADRAQEFVLYGIDQGDRHLVGTWSYTNGAVGNKTPPRVVIEGTKTTDGVFWPDVRLEAREGRTGKWKQVANPPNEGERATVIIEPNAINLDLTVNLDAFKRLIGRYESGRIVLKTNRVSVFELKDLVPPTGQAVVFELKDPLSPEQHTEQANNKSIEVYSNASDLRNPDKAIYWKQSSDASNVTPARTLAVIGNTTGQSPAVGARSGLANAGSKQRPIQFLLSVSQEKPNSGVLALQLILVNTSRVLQDLSKTGKISVTCKIGTPTLYVPGQYIGITRSLEPEIAALKLKPGKWVAQEIGLQPELTAQEIAEVSATCEIGGVAYKSNTIILSEK